MLTTYLAHYNTARPRPPFTRFTAQTRVTWTATARQVLGWEKGMERPRRQQGLRAHAAKSRGPWWRRKSVQVGLGILGAAITATLTAELTGLFNSGVAAIHPQPSPSMTSPLGMRVEVDGLGVSACGGHAIDKPVADVKSPPFNDLITRSHDWAKALGGIDVQSTSISMTLSGISEQAVVLQRLRVHVVKRGPVKGQAVYAVGNCGNPLNPRFFDIDLDAASPRATAVAGSDENGVVPAVSFPFRVDRLEPEIFNVVAHTNNFEVSWELLLDWTSGNDSGTQVINDDGRPFDTMGPPVGSPQYRSGPGGWSSEGPVAAPRSSSS